MAGSDQLNSDWNTSRFISRKQSEAPHRVDQHRVDALGQRALRSVAGACCAQVRVDPGVARAHALVVERRAAARRRAARAARLRAARRAAASSSSVADRHQRPQRERVAAGPVAGQRRAHARDALAQLGARREAQARARGSRCRARSAIACLQRVHALARCAPPPAPPGSRAAWPAPRREMAGVAGLVDHGQRDQQVEPQLLRLQHEVQVARQVGGVDAAHHQLGPRGARQAEQAVDGDLLFPAARRERVGAGHVDDRRPCPRLGRGRASPLGQLDRDARVVADARLRAGQAVEQGGLAGVRVAGQRDARLLIALTSMPRASFLRTERRAPRTSSSSGSPSGETPTTATCVPGVEPQLEQPAPHGPGPFDTQDGAGGTQRHGRQFGRHLTR